MGMNEKHILIGMGGFGENAHATDFELVRGWRNEQTDILRTEGVLTKEAQAKYRTWYFEQCSFQHPQTILYMLIDRATNEKIAYGGLVHINWDKWEAETSFLFNPLRKPTDAEPIYRSFLQLLKDCTAKYRLKAWTSETPAFRGRWVAMLARCGWQHIGYGAMTKMGRRELSIIHRMNLGG